MKVVDQNLLEQVSSAARENPRRRKNLNLHDSYNDPCQRLLNAVEPESYIRPHRHLTPPKPETFLAVRGRFAAVVFRENGEIERAVMLEPQGATVGVDIPGGAWHCVLALETESVFFEAKPGPYEAISDKDWAPWAPAEGSVEAPVYLNELKEKVLAWLGNQ